MQTFAVNTSINLAGIFVLYGQSLTSLRLKAEFLLLVSKIAGRSAKYGHCHSANDARHLPTFGRCVSNKDRVKETHEIDLRRRMKSSAAEPWTSTTALRFYLKSIQIIFTAYSLPVQYDSNVQMSCWKTRIFNSSGHYNVNQHTTQDSNPSGLKNLHNKKYQNIPNTV